MLVIGWRLNVVFGVWVSLFLLTISVMACSSVFWSALVFKRRYVLKELELQSLALACLNESASAKLFSEIIKLKFKCELGGKSSRIAVTLNGCLARSVRINLLITSIVP